MDFALYHLYDVWNRDTNWYGLYMCIYIATLLNVSLEQSFLVEMTGSGSTPSSSRTKSARKGQAQAPSQTPENVVVAVDIHREGDDEEDDEEFDEVANKDEGQDGKDLPSVSQEG